MTLQRLFLGTIYLYLALLLPSLSLADDVNGSSTLLAGGHSARFQGYTYRVDEDGGLTVESGPLVRKNWLGVDGRLYESKPTTGFYEISEILSLGEGPQQLVVLNRDGQTFWYDRSQNKFVRFSPVRMRVAQMVTDGKQLFLVEALMMSMFQPQSPDSYRIHSCTSTECSPFGEIRTTIDKDGESVKSTLYRLYRVANGVTAGASFLAIHFALQGQVFSMAMLKVSIVAVAAIFIAREIKKFAHDNPVAAGIIATENELNKELAPVDPSVVTSKYLRQLDRDGNSVPISYESLTSESCGKGLPASVGKDVS